MTLYYVALQSKTHAFLLEKRMRGEGVTCELTYMPRQIMSDVCNMGVRFEEIEFPKAVVVIKKSGLPSCRLYKEIITPMDCTYVEIGL